MAFKTNTSILFVIPSLKIAGAEKVCCNICDNLNYDEFEVTLISLSDEIPLWETLRNKDKIKLYTCGEPSQMGFPWFSMKSLIRFRRIIKEIKPDIVHSHLWGIHCIYLYSFLLLKKRPKFIATIHSSEFIYTSKKLSSKIFKFIENTLYKVFKYDLISISNAVQKTVQKQLYYKRLIKIENGIDTVTFSPDKKKFYNNFKRSNYKDAYPILVHVGRASEVKRQEDIIIAVSLLVNSYPSIKLLLIGRENKQKSSTLVESLKVETNIEFIEPNNEIEKFLSISDIGVFPSLYEGLSLAFAEKMSSGLPLIISNIPSLTEMTNHTEAAVVVPIKSPQKIAEAVKYILDNPEKAEQLRLKARKLAVEKYSISTMVEKHMDFYKKNIMKLGYD